MPVHITFDVREPETHLVHVTQVFPGGEPERTFRMAAWVPGSYKIRDFGRHVQDVEAEVEGKKVPVTQSGKDAWTVKTQGKPVTVRFAAYSRELTVDTSHVTADHAHLFPATLVLYDATSRALPHKVEIKAPRGWRTWSGLESDSFHGELRDAEDYDHLIDCPMEVGPASSYAEMAFTVRRKKHRFIVWNPPSDMDKTRITKDVRAVVEATADLFGGLPYEHYSFITHVAKDHGGGLEHRNSTVLGVDPLALVVDAKIKNRLLPLVAHEFFHTWNVKRILPQAFQPYDLQTEVYTDLLWLFEGFTTYYELPLLYRAGVVDDDAFGEIAAEMLKYYEMAVGRKRRTVAEASRLTWTLLYQPHEHNVNRNVSYYTKGMWVGLCLDHHLRTHGCAEGLDVVMRYMWKHHVDIGIPEDGFAAIVKEATGVEVASLLRRWTHGTTELPVDKAFKGLGWDVKREHSDPKKPMGLGVTFKQDGVTIDRITDDVPAFKVLQPQDKVVALDGMEWSGERFAELANHRKTEMEVHVFREGRLRALTVPLTELPKDKITLSVRKGDAVATKRRKAWLG